MKTVIGIDPAFRIGGFWIVILDYTDKTADFKPFANFVEFHEWLLSGDAPESAIVGVENSNLQNVNFDKSGSRAVIQRKGRNAGTNQAVSEFTVIACRRKYGAGNVVEMSPLQKGAKWSKVQFQAVVHQDDMRLLKPVKNQDMIDAYKIAYLAMSRARMIKI